MILAVVDDCAPAQLHRAFEAGVDDCLMVGARMEQLSSRLPFVERRVRRRQERVRTEQALRESEAKARAIVETTVDGVITIDKRGHIESFNDAAEAIFGYAEEEVKGENVKVLMPSPYREEHDGYMRSYRETGRRKIIGIGREVTGRRKDGSTFPMDLAVSEVQLGDRRIFTGIVRDITERRRLEKEILDVTEQERRRIGQDLHDGLGQMLTGIGLLSQNLARQLEQHDQAEAEEAAEITDLIREADQYARDLARGLTPVDLEASGLVAALERLVANAERLFDIECVFDEVGSALIHDGTTATHMYRIAQEAVSNAVRHGQAKRIKISLAAGAAQTRLRIQDDGVGFSEANTEGPGMGVHIMEYRARIVGGTLDISSTPGTGTTVTFTLPHRGAAQPAHPADATTQPERHA
jgi:two-component system CheB/CheR fusion protein